MTPFAPWEPDRSTFSPTGGQEALNVIAAEDGYGPFPAFAYQASALTARVQGAAAYRQATNTIFNFAGDVTKLYKAASDGLSFADVSRSSGVAYATPSDGWWNFTQFGDYVIAVNQADATQYFLMGTSTKFEPLAGSPPRAAFCTTVRDFVVLARLSTDYNALQWSAIQDPTDWTASVVTLSDSQSFAEGGIVMGIVGGEFGIVFQERAIQRMVFEGPPYAFRFDKIVTDHGCRVERSIASYQDLVFYLGTNGFGMIQGGTSVVPIGDNKVDKWIEANLDQSKRDRCSAAIDPLRKVYMFSFPTAATGGNPDTILIYHWPTGKWTRARIDHEFIYSALVQSGVTIDGLASFSSTIDAIPYVVDSPFWSGSGRLFLAGFDTSHRQGSFSGASLEAIAETPDIQFTQGRKTLLRSVRPMIEGSSVTPRLTVKSRNRLQDSITTSSESTTNSDGLTPVRVNARYHRLRWRIPASDTWTLFTGIDDVTASPMGRR